MPNRRNFATSGLTDCLTADLIGDDDLVDVLDDPGQVADDEDDDDGGQRGGVVGLRPAEIPTFGLVNSKLDGAFGVLSCHRLRAMSTWLVLQK